MNILTLIDSSGRRLISMLWSLHALLALVIGSVQSALLPRQRGGGIPVSETLIQVYFTGVEGLLPVSVLAAGIGLATGFYSNSNLLVLGGNRMISQLLMGISVESIGPFVISLLVIARSGTAVASEVGSMRVGNEIEALRMLCRNPQTYLLFPRIAGGVAGIVCLGMAFTMSLIAAYSLSISMAGGASPMFVFTEITGSWSGGFLLTLFAKYAVSGALIFAISCRQGLSVNRSSAEVPKVTSRAVLQSIYGIFALHAFFIALDKLLPLLEAT
jgi:phospholipid/cholesterol/gamma-HCH transport system permease protein